MLISFGPFVLDGDTRQLRKDGEEVRLTPKAFELLLFLAENRPKAMSKAQLIERIWPGVFVTDEGLPRLVNEIRMAIGDPAGHSHWVRTVRGFGYAFAAEPDEETRTRGGDGCRLTWSSRDIPLVEGEHIIGRDPHANICLKASVVSRRHARITVTDGCARIEDLCSRNGTFVGSTRLTEPHVLNDGEEIRVGDFTLIFHGRPSLLTQTGPL